MPVRLSLTLRGPAPDGPHAHASGLRALVYASIARGDPALAQWLHTANQPKPLTVGPLRTADDNPELHSVLLTSTADPFSDALLHGLPEEGSEIRLGPQTYTVAERRLICRVSFGSIVQDLPDSPAVTIRLLTPTAHHAPGTLRRTILTPQPRLYLGSWLARWNLSCDLLIPETLLSAAEEYIVVSGFRGGTVAVPLDARRTFIGYIGTVQFTVLGNAPEARQLRETLWALARFAEFCGTGVETMRGMGQTRLVRRPDPDTPTRHGHPLCG